MTAPTPAAATPEDPGSDENGGDGAAIAEGDGRSLLRRRWVMEWLIVLTAAVGVAFGVRAYVAQSYIIPSPSMEPTLMIGDRILVNKLSYHLHGVGLATSWSSPHLRRRRPRRR